MVYKKPITKIKKSSKLILPRPLLDKQLFLHKHFQIINLSLFKIPIPPTKKTIKQKKLTRLYTETVLIEAYYETKDLLKNCFFKMIVYKELLG